MLVRRRKAITPSTASMVDPVQQAGRSTAAGWAIVFAAAFALYAATASRGPQWQDSGAHIMRILDGVLIHPLGLALSHPLHYWLGRAITSLHFAPPAYAITLISALAAAAAVANVFGITLSMTRTPVAAVLAAASLAFAHTFWKMATLVETYTLTAMLLSAELWCAILFIQSRRKGYLIGAVALNGLGFANHNLALLTTPLLAAMAIWAAHVGAVRARHIFSAAVLWLVGALPYTWLILEEGLQTGDWQATIRSAMFGHSYADQVLNYSMNVRLLGTVAALLLLNFPNLVIPAAVLGMFSRNDAATPAPRRLVLAALVIHFLFVARYTIVDQFTFFLPTYVTLTIVSGIGIAAARSWRPAIYRAFLVATVGSLVATPCLYIAAPAIARWADVLAAHQRDKPYRDDYVYLFSAWGGADPSAGRLAEAVLAACGDHGLIIVSDSTARPVVQYAVRMADSDDILIRSELDALEAERVLFEGGAVVFVPRTVGSEPPPLATAGWAPSGDLYVAASP